MLNQEQIEADLLDLHLEMRNFTGDDEQALKVFAKSLASLLVKHIKTLEIVYSNGLVAPSGTTGGPVTGKINHTVK